MKKSKLMAAILALGLIGGAGYMVSQQKQPNNQVETIVEDESITDKEIEHQQNEESKIGKEDETVSDAQNTVEPDESIGSQEEDKVQEDVTQIEQKQQEIATKLDIANAAFEDDDKVNLYPALRTSQKKKWLKQINENAYFETEEDLQYQISGLYEIAENQYYIVGWSATTDGKLKLAEKWSEDQKKICMPKEIFELVLRQEDDNYFVTQAIYPSVEILSSEEVDLYKKEEQEASNVAIEYKKVDKLEDVDAYVDYLDEVIGDLQEETINDNGQSDLTQYVQYAIEDLSSTSAVAEENTIDVKSEILEQMKEQMTSAKDKFDDLLSKNDVSFNKSLNTVLKLQTEETSFKKPIYIQLPDSFEDLGDITGLRIVIDETSYVYINGSDLEALASLKIKIERLKNKSTYEITFLDKQDEVISQLDQTITFAFPAKDEFTTVLATYGEESQNWGGQYEAATRSISFGTKYSGTYQIVDNNVKIKDIGNLPSSQQSSIRFMVSKGYLNLENERFNPNSTFTRYEFAEALVKMFFALDTSLETSFKDVPEDSPYYPYVASGETYEIINGYADQTFKGKTNILKQEVISLCARTIADQKGYVYPEHKEDYLQFADAADIGKWATDDIALAVQTGLTTGGGSLMPKSEITKAESAEVLHGLFMLLHETTPGNVVEITATEKTYSILGTLLVLALLLWIIKRFIKRNKVIITMIACTAAMIITLIILFGGGL